MEIGKDGENKAAAHAAAIARKAWRDAIEAAQRGNILEQNWINDRPPMHMQRVIGASLYRGEPVLRILICYRSDHTGKLDDEGVLIEYPFSLDERVFLGDWELWGKVGVAYICPIEGTSIGPGCEEYPCAWWPSPFLPEYLLATLARPTKMPEQKGPIQVG